MKDNFVMKIWNKEMGIWNYGGRLRGLGMFLLSFHLLSKRESGTNLVPLEEKGAAGRKEKGFWILGR